MKSITIHNLNEKLYYHLHKKAKEGRTSLNQTIKSILEEHFGITETKVHKNQFKKFVGIWNNKDLNEFQKATKDFNKIDKSDWE